MTAGGINGLWLVSIAIAGAFLVGRFLFQKRGEAAAWTNSLFGLVGLAFWFATAIFLMIGGGILGLIAGAVIVVGVVFVGSWHASVLAEEDIRSKIAG